MERNKNSSTIPTEDLLRTREWSGYLAYLRAWVDEHASPLFWGMVAGLVRRVVLQ